MDKQKQIEEIAHKLCKSKSPCIECLKRSRDAGIFVNKTDCECYLHAKILHKHYQPKLPEGSVVLTEEEFNEFREDSAKVKFLKKEIEKQAVKEYCDKLKKVIHERDYVSGYAEIGLQEEINELAKEFGVEL